MKALEVVEMQVLTLVFLWWRRRCTRNNLYLPLSHAVSHLFLSVSRAWKTFSNPSSSISTATISTCNLSIFSFISICFVFYQHLQWKRYIFSYALYDLHPVLFPCLASLPSNWSSSQWQHTHHVFMIHLISFTPIVDHATSRKIFLSKGCCSLLFVFSSFMTRESLSVTSVHPPVETVTRKSHCYSAGLQVLSCSKAWLRRQMKLKPVSFVTYCFSIKRIQV